MSASFLHAVGLRCATASIPLAFEHAHSVAHGSHPDCGMLPGQVCVDRQIVHHGFYCNASGMDPIVGARFHLIGEDYDLCEQEHALLPEEDRRRYEKIISTDCLEPTAPTPPMPPTPPTTVPWVHDALIGVGSHNTKIHLPAASTFEALNPLPISSPISSAISSSPETSTKGLSGLQLAASAFLSHTAYRLPREDASEVSTQWPGRQGGMGPGN